jgi:hypothetical protein
MVNFTIEEIRALMEKPANIRNMSVIAHGEYLLLLIDSSAAIDRD